MSLDLKVVIDAELQRSGGKEFQSRGREQLKARLPLVLRLAGGTLKWMEEEDVRARTGVTMWRRSDPNEDNLSWNLKVLVRSKAPVNPSCH